MICKGVKDMDISLFYQEKGKGIPFIFLHGNGGDSNYFKKQIDYFSNNYRVIAIDTRGHGKTERGTRPFTIEQFADDLNEFLNERKIEKAIILGFSDGANIAMKFVMKYPNKVSALILNGGNLDTKGIKKRIQIPIDIGYSITKMFIKKSEVARRNMELLNLMVNEPNINIENLHKIKVPTLVIAGTHDMIKESHTKKIAENISGSKLSIIKGNHFIAIKEAEKFNNEIVKFLETNKEKI